MARRVCKLDQVRYLILTIFEVVIYTRNYKGIIRMWREYFKHRRHFNSKWLRSYVNCPSTSAVILYHNCCVCELYPNYENVLSPQLCKNTCQWLTNCQRFVPDISIFPKTFAPPSAIGINMIFWRKIVICHTKYPKNFRASFCSPQLF